MRIVIFLYENMTALDAIGPYEVLSRLPGATVDFVAETPGLVRADTGFLDLNARKGIAEIDSADILLIPGGPGDRAVMKNEAVLDWVRRVHETAQYTTSVCTGSLILGAAGVLEGLDATTHWARLDVLKELGANPVEERVVDRGKVVTAAGVSAGIDMALRLVEKIAGPELAQALQLGIEYDPDPPHDCGSLHKAPELLVSMVRATMAQPD